MRVHIAARGAPGVGRHRHAAQQDERAARHRRHRRLRLPVPPPLSHAHVREDSAAGAARHTGMCFFKNSSVCK